MAEKGKATTIVQMVRLWDELRCSGALAYGKSYRRGVMMMLNHLVLIPKATGPIGKVWESPESWQSDYVVYCRRVGLAPGSIDCHIRMLATCLADMGGLIDAGIQWSDVPLTSNIILPAPSELPSLGKARAQPGLPSQDDLAAFFASCSIVACEQNKRREPTERARMAGLMLLVSCTGMRPDEAARIQAANIILDRVPSELRIGSILIDAATTKSKRSREVTITPFIWAFLRRFAEAPRRTGHVFVNQNGRCMQERLDLPMWISPRQLRANFVTRLLQSGVALGTVSQLVGHSSVTTTMVYIRRDADTERDRVSALHVPALLMGK